MVDGGELPQWVSWIGAAGGVLVATVLVRLGWVKGGGETEPQQPEQGRLIGALVDSGSVNNLTLAIHSHGEVLRAEGEESRRELRALSDEVRRLANKLER